jgi:hypothetical protein
MNNTKKTRTQSLSRQLIVNLEPETEDAAIDKRQQDREAAARLVGTEEPIFTEYAPSFEFAIQLLKRRANGQ